MTPTRDLLFRLDALIQSLREVQDFLDEHSLTVTRDYVQKAATSIASARTDLMYAESHLLTHLDSLELRVVLWPVLDKLNSAPYPNEDPRYPPEHPLSKQSNEAARRNRMQIPKDKL